MISMVPPYAWPRSIADLRDSSLNPDSFTPVDGTGYTPTGLDMGDPPAIGVRFPWHPGSVCLAAVRGAAPFPRALP